MYFRTLKKNATLDIILALFLFIFLREICKNYKN